MSFLISASFFFSSTIVPCLVFTVLYVSSYVLWSPLITARVRLWLGHVRTLFTFSYFYAVYVDFPSEENILKRFLLTFFATVPRLQPRISYPSIAISLSTSRIIYVVFAVFSLSQSANSRNEKFGGRNVWKVRCVERDYYKDCSLAILRLKFRHNIPPDFDFLVSSRFLDPSIANFSLFPSLFRLFSRENFSS